MSAFLDSMIARAKQVRKTIVLPEGNDERTLQAAEQVLASGIANVIILGDIDAMQVQGFNLEGASLIDNRSDEAREGYADALYELRKSKGMEPDTALSMMDNPLYFGAMMVKQGDADGMVCGACNSTSDVLRASLQVLKTAPGVKYVSSFFVMVVPDCEFGQDGAFIFSDCGLEIQPNAEKLSEIALASARSWQQIFGTEPRVAMLSHSTLGSTVENDDRNKVIEATALAKAAAPDLLIDGELQLDAAIVESVAKLKAPDSPVAGKANVLIFPDLDAGNIGYKIVQRLAKAEAYGPITQGIAAPVNDLSRGCTADDIVGVVAITAVQAQ